MSMNLYLLAGNVEQLEAHSYEPADKDQQM